MLPLRSRPCWDETGISQRRHGTAWSIRVERVRKGSKDEAGEMTRQRTWYYLTAQRRKEKEGMRILKMNVLHRRHEGSFVGGPATESAGWL